MTTVTARDVRCNHCGLAFMSSSGVVASPMCGSCRKDGHTTSMYGCHICIQQLEEDLRTSPPITSDVLERAISKAERDINFFDND